MYACDLENDQKQSAGTLTFAFFLFDSRFNFKEMNVLTDHIIEQILKIRFFNFRIYNFDRHVFFNETMVFVFNEI